MPLLIDGHNLIGQMPDLKLSDPDDEAKLIKRLQTFGLLERKQITVVFDPGGHDNHSRLFPEIQQHGSCKAIWAMPGHKADDLIRQLVSNVRDKQGLLVITSDTAVAKFVRVNGIKVQSSQDFARQLTSQLAERIFADAKPHPTRKENAQWAEVFKEPAPTQPAPKPDPIAIKKAQAEEKRKRRAEQLAKQAKGAAAKRLYTGTTPTRKVEDEEEGF
jgi:hypothetical protein